MTAFVIRAIGRLVKTLPAKGLCVSRASLVVLEIACVDEHGKTVV